MKNIFSINIMILLLIIIGSSIETKAQTASIVKAEYFIDTDPGFGLANNIVVLADSLITNQNLSVNLNNINIGFHNLCIRIQDANGKWSLTNNKSFFKTSLGITNAPNIVKAEYFIDNDPGYGLGNNIPISAASSITNQSAVIDLNGLSVGFHSISIRTQDINGIWSIVNSKAFFKTGLSVEPDIVKMEYFIDTDPGFGMATNISINPSISLTNNSSIIDLGTINEGFHKLYIRAKNSNGVWSVTNAMTFLKTLNNILPNIVQAEYFFDTDPGFGNANSISINPNTNLDSIIIAPNYCLLSIGTHQLFVRCLDANGKWSITNNKTIMVQQGMFYADTDQDGFGNPNDSIPACSAPLNYVSNSLDCNDNDSLEHPNQTWYIDQDGDDYGTGIFITQCTRPLNGFTSNEIIAINGDCNDNNASISPGAQYFTYSGTPDFISTLVAPFVGSAYTNFNFEVNYFDINNVLPPPTFPRVILDYEGNNNLTNPNDRVIIMTPFDINDSNTIDGKKYIATISSLPIGTNYECAVQSVSNGCITKIGNFNYPDVLQQPDIEIFANDITFSNQHPNVSSPLIVNATVHNESDYAAENFVVHLRNQYDSTLIYPNILVGYLAPHSSYNVSWNITTPPVPAWCPMEVSIDYTNQIPETNELDNSAIRPFINGDFNLPGGIHVVSYVNPAIGFGGATTSLSGSAHYFGTSIPLPDSSVAGATVNYTIVETGASYSAYTNSLGNFTTVFSNPLAPGVYHIFGSITDFTLTGTFNTQFEVLQAPSCVYPDLKPTINVTNPYGMGAASGQSIKLVEGDSLFCTAGVSNIGYSASNSTILSVSNQGALPSIAPYSISPLGIGTSQNVNFNVKYPSFGFYNLSVNADAGNTELECNESNGSGVTIQVLPILADIVPFYGPGGTQFNCDSTNLNFFINNLGGAASGLFNCTVIHKRNDSIIATDTIVVSNIPSAIYNTNSFSFSLPFAPTIPGIYSFELKCDLPDNSVIEFNENNNIGLYFINVLECKPNFTFQSCESFDVESSDGEYTIGSNITLKGVLQNSGNLPYNGSIEVQYQLSGGNIFSDTITVNLNPGSSIPISKTILNPSPAGQTLLLIADPSNLINESNESDNSIANKMCWDFYIDSLKACTLTSAFWESTYLVNQVLFASVGIGSANLYDADTLYVKYEVSGPGLSGSINLGNAILYQVEKTCFCPVSASLPTSFVFPQTGTYTFKMTVDPDQKYGECNESNNILIRNVVVNNLPDMNTLSQFIAPSLLNPQVNQNVSFNVTYQNLGFNNISDTMKLKLLVDNVEFSTVNVNGLINGDNATISFPNLWSSNLVGVHVIRAIIDAENNITELNEINNEATRTIVVGPSANLYFQTFASLSLYPMLNSNISIKARVGNSGDIACQGDMQLFYVDNNLDTILFYTQFININGHDSVNFTIPWTVLDNKTKIIGKIINSSALEFTYDDNQSQFELGQINLILNALPACDANNMGSITTTAIGGEPPYIYVWNTGYIGQTLIAPVGSYSVTVTDITGQTVASSSVIIPCPPVTLNLHLFIEGYYEGGGFMTSTLMNQGELFLPTDVDSITVELHDSISPYNMIETYTGILQTNGNMIAYFSSNVNAEKYYIVLKHRNSITTWSAQPVLLTSNCTYEFSTSAQQAYGDNMIEVSNGIWALYSGDLNADDNIDLLDGSILETAINNFEFGYVGTDLNGDGNVDLLDSPIVEGNVNGFIFSIHP